MTQHQRTMLEMIASQLPEGENKTWLNHELVGMQGYIAHKVIDQYFQGGVGAVDNWLTKKIKWFDSLPKRNV